MDFLNEYITMITVGICLCVGFILKNIVPTNKINKFIPLIMGALGVVINLWVNCFDITPQVVLGGLVSGLASTGMYEAFHQFIKKKGSTDDDNA